MITQATVYGVSVDWTLKGVPPYLIEQANADLHDALQTVGAGYLYGTSANRHSKITTFFFQTRAAAEGFAAMIQAAPAFVTPEGEEKDWLDEE